MLGGNPHMIAVIGELLAPIAPASMGADAQGIFLRVVSKRLDEVGIRVDEVIAVAAEVACKITRHQQMLHAISDAVHEKRNKRFSPPGAKPNPLYWIDQESQRRRGEARTKAEIEDAFQWEQQARRDAGLVGFTPFQSTRRGFSVETLHALSKHHVFYKQAKENGWASPEMFAEVDALNQRGVAPPANPVPAPLPASNRGDAPLTRAELDAMPAETASLGIAYGYLKRIDGKLVEVIQ